MTIEKHVINLGQRGGMHCGREKELGDHCNCMLLFKIQE